MSDRRGAGLRRAAHSAAELMRVIGEALAVRRRRRWGYVGAGIYLVIYLFAIQNVLISPGRDLSRFVSIPSVQVVADWPSKVFQQQAPFFYESVAVVYPANHVTILVSPVNIAMGLLLGALVGLNVTVALHAMATAASCGKRGFGGLLGAIPGFLTGFACCVPTFALVLGAQFTVFLIAIRSWFFPVAVAALVISALWNARRGRQLGPAAIERPPPAAGRAALSR